MNLQKSTWVALLNIVGLSVLFVCLQWNSLNMPFERDEGEYAYSAWIMSEGHVPYRDSYLQKPPMIIYTYLASQLVSADSVWPPRILASLVSLLTAFLVGWIAQHLYGKRAGWLAVWMFLPLSMLPIFLPFAANTEKFLLLPLIVTLYFYVRRGSQGKWWEWLAAGTSGAIAVFFKQIALIPVAIIFSFWAVETWRYHRAAAIAVRNVSIAVAGAVSVSIVLLAFFIYKGALRELIECTVTYNYYYMQVGRTDFQFFFSMILFLAEQWWPLILLSGWYVYKRRPRWFVLGALLVASLVTASKDLNGHYYIVMVPFLAIVSSSALDSFLSWLKTKIHDETKQRRFGLLIPAMVVLILILPSRGVILLRPNELAETIYGGNPFVESPIVAQRVNELVPEHEALFVAGSEPQILFLSKRMSLTRFVIMYPLTMPTPFMKKYQDEVKVALEKSPPRVVVLALPRMSWSYQSKEMPEFVSYVDRMTGSGGFQLIGGYLRDRSGNHWQEPLKKEDVPLCRLIILRRGQSTP
jgi:hypothetical protein